MDLLQRSFKDIPASVEIKIFICGHALGDLTVSYILEARTKEA